MDTSENIKHTHSSIRRNIGLNMNSDCWDNKQSLTPVKFPSDDTGSNSKVQTAPGLLLKCTRWCLPGDVVHAVNPLKF